MSEYQSINNLDLAKYIQSGDTIVVGQGVAEPIVLTQALIDQRDNLGQVNVFIGPLYQSPFSAEHADHLKFLTYCGAGTNKSIIEAGAAEVILANYSELAPLFARGSLPSDVVFLLLGEARNGRYNTGLVNDYMIDAARRARVVIAEISDRVPWTCGAELPEDIVPDVIVRTSREPISLGSSVPTEDDLKLARNVAEFIPDAATIEIGIGTIPDLVLEALSGHKNLALHSGVIGDVAIELIKKGVIDNSLKPFDQGVSIAGFLLGTRKLFDYAHENPSIRLAPTSHTHDIRVLSRLPNFYAVNAALEVDLTGQVNAEVIGNRYLGAVGGQVDFSRGANLSEGGRAIIAVSSTARGGSVSRIVNRIESGIVTTPRVDVDIIVSEWGSAELRGTTLKQRAERICAIAHPKFREGLEREAHRMFQTL